ncbi:MAG: ABC transporter ATP-binding protein [Flavobacteriales bacterium]
MESSNQILTFRDLTIGYETNSLVDSINISASKGDLIALMGLNGTGKTTLFKTILGEIPPISGQILLNGNLIDFKDIQHQISVVFTNRISIFGFTVRDMVAMGRMPYTNRFGKLSTEDNQIVSNYISELNLTEIEDLEINNLSDGQFQKVMIARALAQETSLLLLDEPTAFLDIKNKKMIHSLLSKLSSNNGKTVIVSTHNDEFCKEYCSKAWIIKNNKLIEKDSKLISDQDFD